MMNQTQIFILLVLLVILPSKLEGKTMLTLSFQKTLLHVTWFSLDSLPRFRLLFPLSRSVHCLGELCFKTNQNIHSVF